MKYEQFLELYKEGPEAVYQVLSSVIQLNALLIERTEKLEKRVKELEDRLNKNSKNSSKPPSTDEFIKPKSNRKKSDKKSGGQKGHKGHTLKMSDAPDEVITHKVEACQSCGHSLEEVQAKDMEKRQVFDIPPLKMNVTEHRTKSKLCSCCGLENNSHFPEGVDLPVQYGSNLRALLVYLNQYQLIPYKRTVELIEDICGHTLSEATVYNAIASSYEALEPVEEKIANSLIASDVVHLDETGIRVEGERQWLHVVSTAFLTHYAHHAKRGSKATEDIGILPLIEGLAVHDYWKPYYNYDCLHSLCNAHHLRELTGIAELTGQQWPQEMIDLLLEIKAVVEQRKTTATELSTEEIKKFEERYENIIENGYASNPPPPEREKKQRGRQKQTKARNLLNRLKNHRHEVLAFMYNLCVPFDNNQAERDLRMMKVKQKISGVFRSNQGAKMFCRIRGYISTARKNSIPVLKAIKDSLERRPFVPSF